jgi:hypothetical protein
MLFCVQTAGESSVYQNDRFVAMTAGTGLLAEARSPAERVSTTETRTLTLRFSRELLPLRTAAITEGCARGMDCAAPAMHDKPLAGSRGVDIARLARDQGAVAVLEDADRLPGEQRHQDCGQ